MSKYGKYTWVDKGWESIRKRVTEGAPNTHARVGFLGPDSQKIHPARADSEHPLTVEEVGLLNEFGSESAGVPERSFLRRALQWKNRKELKYILANASRNILFRGMTRVTAMKKAGEWGVQKVREQILSGETPPEQADYTVWKKGHDRTLTETGTMARAIRYVVMKGREQVAMGGDEGGEDE